MQCVSHTRVWNFKSYRPALKSEAECSNIKLSGTSLVTITAEDENFILMCNMGMSPSALEKKAFFYLENILLHRLNFILFMCLKKE